MALGLALVGGAAGCPGWSRPPPAAGGSPRDASPEQTAPASDVPAPATRATAAPASDAGDLSARRARLDALLAESAGRPADRAAWERAMAALVELEELAAAQLAEPPPGDPRGEAAERLLEALVDVRDELVRREPR